MGTQTQRSKSEQSRRGRPLPFPLNARIKVLVDESPRREGTRAAKVFELYRKCKTVGEVIEKGRTLKGRKNRPAPVGAHDLRWDKERKHIAILK